MEKGATTEELNVYRPDESVAEVPKDERREPPGATPEQQPREKSRPLIAVLIATIAVVAAIATWRAEVAATRAEAASQQGVAMQILATGNWTSDRTIAVDSGQQVSQVYDLQNAGIVAADSAGSGGTSGVPDPGGDDQTKASETSPPMQAIAPGSAAAAAVAQEYVGEWALRNAWLYNGYVKTPKSGQYLFNVEAATKDLVLEDSGNTASAVLATTSKKDFAAVEADESRRLHLLVVDLVLVLALALAATAQLAKQRRALVPLGVTSAILFFGATIVMTLIEVG